MDNVIDIAKQLKNFAKTDIRKLFIVGHSLGGYLASYLTSDLVDYSYNPKGKSRIKVSDIHGELTLDNIIS